MSSTIKQRNSFNLIKVHKEMPQKDTFNLSFFTFDPSLTAYKWTKNLGIKDIPWTMRLSPPRENLFWKAFIEINMTKTARMFYRSRIRLEVDGNLNFRSASM